MSKYAIEITDDNFEQLVLNSKKPVLIDFWAAWCHPCQVMSPIVDEIAKEVENNLLVGKLNVDENPKTAEKFDVMSIPTFILFENGEALKTSVGSANKEKLYEAFGKWFNR